MARIQAGSEGAFTELVRRYESPLYNYLRRFTGSAADAEDLFQETFVRVYRHRRRFRTSARFRPWVYRIATNLARDYLRAQRLRRTVPLDASTRPGTEAEGLARALASSGPDPSALAAAEETRARLEAALADLPARHRAVFIMARYQGMRYEEIAAALRVPTGTVKSRMNKAVKFLLNALEDTR